MFEELEYVDNLNTLTNTHTPLPESGMNAIPWLLSLSMVSAGLYLILKKKEGN